MKKKKTKRPLDLDFADVQCACLCVLLLRLCCVLHCRVSFQDDRCNLAGSAMCCCDRWLSWYPAAVAALVTGAYALAAGVALLIGPKTVLGEWHFTHLCYTLCASVISHPQRRRTSWQCFWRLLL